MLITTDELLLFCVRNGLSEAFSIDIHRRARTYYLFKVRCIQPNLRAVKQARMMVPLNPPTITTIQLFSVSPLNQSL